MIMKEPRVQLKNVKTFRGMEWHGLNADVWINGVKCLFWIDSGDGDCYSYEENITHKNPELVEKNIQLLKDYVATLPPKKYDGGLSGKPFEVKYTLDMYLDDVLVKQDIEKQKKKMRKLFNTSIVFGVEGGNSYRHMNFKNELKNVPLAILQSQVDRIVKDHLEVGETIFNDNLEELGVKLP